MKQQKVKRLILEGSFPELSREPRISVTNNKRITNKIIKVLKWQKKKQQ
jgi:hypothetical protein